MQHLMNDMIVLKLKLSYWLYLSKSSTANCHIASILSGKDLSFDIKELSCNNGRIAVAHWIKMRPSLQPFPPSFSNSRSRPFTNGEVEVVDNSKAFPAATPFQPQESFAATTTTTTTSCPTMKSAAASTTCQASTRAASSPQAILGPGLDLQ